MQLMQPCMCVHDVTVKYPYFEQNSWIKCSSTLINDVSNLNIKVDIPSYASKLLL